MFYSATKNTWFHPSFRHDYELSGAWPDDATEYPREVFDDVVSRRPADKIMVPDANGCPVLQDPPQPDRTKASLLSDVAAKRWQVETGGISIGSTPIATDRESRSQLTSVYSDLQNSLIADTPWKAADGSFTLVTRAEIEAAAQAVAAHVRACFAAEQAHAVAIEALHTQAELDSYDIHTDWPSGR
ncbi:DUF4376 domain-containing protein [Aeromonas rivipollensis]|uniref:DUF4376 domain-containing protein n=1 Tax=Aeromonas rivipollensis TaxID=948519 RepID=UPI00259EE40B|nr:DUF4376 domain-containing protein [Aeromonas rivipollensis]MDM5094376.1 DUF4376 domain-containing protein [Aeromonas rivipollensis]